MDVISIIAGAVLGFLSGLGTGGGSLLILWLCLIKGFSQEDARIINLMFYVPAAFISVLFQRKHQKLPWKIIVPACVAGCITAGIVSWITAETDLTEVRPVFGILLIAVGLKELFYRERKFK